MTTTTMRNHGRRRRTSDGTVVCSGCLEIIPEGTAYVEEGCYPTGVLVERDYCLNCLESSERSDAASWLFVIATCVGTLGLFCLMVVG